MPDLVCGIDVGTSSVRALVCDLAGGVHGSASSRLPPTRASAGRAEQAPDDWWRSTCDAVRGALAGVDAGAVGSVAVDATSGTIVAVDADLSPVGPGIMYGDARAAGSGVEPAALARMVWLRDHDPAFGRVRWILHQGDFINARLAGAVTATDWSTALKSGCDLVHGGWSAFIECDLGFPTELLPERVVAPGTPIGEIGAGASTATGLAAGTPLRAGATDGTAALFASGAGRPGEFNSTLGTTLVLKGITDQPLHDPDGVVYCHRHPDGAWLPGGASNVGCAALESCRDELPALDDAARDHLPSPVVAYPLGRARQERFPFVRGDIAQFVAGHPPDPAARHAALLQGVALVERWCYEKLVDLGARVDRVLSTGGGTRSAVWTQLRADVLGRCIEVPDQVETALGAAILAASGEHGSVGAAVAAMVRVRRRVEPETGRGPDYDALYRRFRDECRQRWGVS